MQPLRGKNASRTVWAMPAASTHSPRMATGSGTGANARNTPPAPPDSWNDPPPVFSEVVVNVGCVAPVVTFPLPVATRQLYGRVLSKDSPLSPTTLNVVGVIFRSPLTTSRLWLLGSLVSLPPGVVE